MNEREGSNFHRINVRQCVTFVHASRQQCRMVVWKPISFDFSSLCQKSVVFNFVWCAWNNMSVNLLSTLFYLLKEMYTKLPLSEYLTSSFSHSDSYGNAFNNMLVDSFHLHCVQMWCRKERLNKKFSYSEWRTVYLSKNLSRVNKNFSMFGWNKFRRIALLRMRKRTHWNHDLIDSSFYSRILRSTTANSENIKGRERKNTHIPYLEFVDYLFTLDNPQRWNQQKHILSFSRECMLLKFKCIYLVFIIICIVRRCLKFSFIWLWPTTWFKRN